MQVVVWMDPRQCCTILQAAWERFHKQGEAIELNKEYKNFFNQYSIMFIAANDCGRKVYRILIPDKENKFYTDLKDCDPTDIYKRQAFLDTSDGKPLEAQSN